jgi:MTH538 TIR-like domain (DUF1863).
MAKGFNKAEWPEKLIWILESKSVQERPCVFLSHKKEDKSECRKIAEYFKNAEIDYYLDELDVALQDAASSGDPTKITESIKKGIRESSHMLVVVSEKTYKSHWVPFEVGYGHAAIVDKNLDEKDKVDKIRLSILTLKDISEKSLPDFMQVGNIIRGTKSLNKYISDISGRLEKSLINESRLFSNSLLRHPLDDVLNWQL